MSVLYPFISLNIIYKMCKYMYMHIPLCMGHQMVGLENTPSSTAIGQRSKVMPHFFFSQRVVPDVSRFSWGTFELVGTGDIGKY